jgi:hypothetical protein
MKRGLGWGQTVCCAVALLGSRLVQAQVPAAAEEQFSEPPRAPTPSATPEAAAPPLVPAAEPAPLVPVTANATAAPPAEATPAPFAPTPADVLPASADRPLKLFASLALGAGYFHANSGSSDDSRRFSGGTVAGQIVLAGRLGRRRTATIGGAYLRDQVLALSSKDELIDGDEPHLDEVSFGLWVLGFFSDFALQQAPGLHFQAVVGLGGLSVDAPDRDADSPFGLALNVGAGYDFRIAKHLALGALLRATYAPLSIDESSGTTVTNFVPSLLLTATTR